MTSKQKFILSIPGYALLFYLWMLLPFSLYTPTHTFHLPNLLWFAHLITLYIHEAGHLVFRIFGADLHILGGSIMQVLVPVVWFFVAKKEESALVPVAVFFTGESLVDLSIYVRDAETQILPLLGGSHVKHDWATFLGKYELLDWGVPLGNLFFFGGLIISLCAIAWGIRDTLRLGQQAKLEGSQGPPD